MPLFSLVNHSQRWPTAASKGRVSPDHVHQVNWDGNVYKGSWKKPWAGRGTGQGERTDGWTTSGTHRTANSLNSPISLWEAGWKTVYKINVSFLFEETAPGVDGSQT